MPNQPLNFAAAISIPFVIQPQERIQHLRSLLAEDKWQFQRQNILKLIEMYEAGEIPVLTMETAIWVRNGEVIDHEPGLNDISEGFIVWKEVRCFSDLYAYRHMLTVSFLTYF